MSACYAIRIVLEGTTPSGLPETMTTTVVASPEQRAVGAHVDEAYFRAGVRGLKAPFRIVAEQEAGCLSPPTTAHLRSRPWRARVRSAHVS